MEQKANLTTIEITEREKILLDFLRETQDGNVVIIVENGQPQRVLEVEQHKGD